MSERSYGQIWPIGEDGKPLERTPMTNDAERVSDIVIRLRENSRIWEPEAVDKFCIEAADIIEAQSKALAEAREALKPFAALWDENLRDYPDSDKSRGRPDDKQAWGFNNIDLTWGDFRRARAAIEAEVDK